MDLIIGLCFGMGSALVLVAMWRIAERVRKDIEAREEARPEVKNPRGEDCPQGPPKPG